VKQVIPSVGHELALFPKTTKMRFAPVHERTIKNHMRGEDITLPCDNQKDKKTIEEE